MYRKVRLYTGAPGRFSADGDNREVILHGPAAVMMRIFSVLCIMSLEQTAGLTGKAHRIPEAWRRFPAG